jgi:tRNA (adenine37-N6)-methyltransferase
VTAIQLRPIGVVRSPITEPVDEGWAGIESEIVLDEALVGAIDGLQEFSHALVVFWMHQAPSPETMRRRPQGRADMPELGILAQRARHRPNPIGVTAVEILGMNGRRLRVRGLDAIDGTPVLDIKPYFPQYDTREARTPEWVGRLMEGYF